MSYLKVVNLQHPTSANVNITLDANSNMYVNNTAINYYQGMKNRIINGGMQFWQRGTSNTTIGNVTTYVADRWYGFVGAHVFQQQIVQSSSVPTGFNYSAAFGRPSGNTNVNSVWFAQNIESVNMIDLQSQSVTLSFWAKTGANYSGGTMTVRVCTGTSADESAATFSAGPASGYTGNAYVVNATQTLTATWTRYSFTGSVASNALEMAVAFGYTPTGTAGADDNIYITGVQLEAGSAATAFERRLYGTELALCQRYYYTSGTSTAPGVMFQAQGTTTTVSFVQHPVKMRVTPTFSYSGTWTYSINGSDTSTSSVTSSSITDFIAQIETATSGLTVGQAGRIRGGIYNFSADF